MDALSYKTTQANKQTVKKDWLLVDAENQPLGRLTSRIAALLRGKHKTCFTPHVDCGDHVVVINAEKVKFTGKKMTDKQYIRYTGYPGGQRFSSPESVLAKHPVKVIEMAIKGMLPKNSLGREAFRNLHVVSGATHKFEAQTPKAVNLNEIF
ncbi:MAG: 50S ribosomal protein L13 [Bacteroidota bacterium]